MTIVRVGVSGYLALFVVRHKMPVHIPAPQSCAKSKRFYNGNILGPIRGISKEKKVSSIKFN